MTTWEFDQLMARFDALESQLRSIGTLQREFLEVLRGTSFAGNRLRLEQEFSNSVSPPQNKQP